MLGELATLIGRHGFSFYPQSLRTARKGLRLFVAGRPGEKVIGLTDREHTLRLSAPVLDGLLTSSGDKVSLHVLSWENYQKLKAVMPISPVRCSKRASFGAGDRLGLVSAAHLCVLERYPVFPVIAQQSPRELVRTRRDFRDVLLRAAMGVLESGYTGKFGADADHIKDDEYLAMGAEAGYSMYTLDLSDWLQDPAAVSAEQLSVLSRSIIAGHTETKLPLPDGQVYAISEQELLKSALIYEKSVEKVNHFNTSLSRILRDYDLEISIDEGSRDTTPEDHLFVVEYLHRSGIDFTSLAPKFPGGFQKGVDYQGNVEALEQSLQMHVALSRILGGYRLSLHSGSDKFSIYSRFKETTEGNFHVKTSGTSWLQAVKVISAVNMPLFQELYALCLENLADSKKAYHVSIAREQFPTRLPTDRGIFFADPNLRQLFHISYGVLLDKRRDRIFETLYAHEADHYAAVAEHTQRHLKAIFSA